MSNKTAVKNEKMIPSEEIVNQKLAILEKMSAALEVQDYDTANAQLELNEALNAKYTFYDQVFEENGKMGLKDITGKIRVPALYADFPETYLYEELRKSPVIAIDEHQKCALVTVDGTGTPLTPFIYDDIHNPVIFPFFMTLQGEKKGFIAPNGKIITPCELDSWTEPFNGITVVKAGEKYGIVTDWGLYVAPAFDEIDDKDEYVYARQGEHWGYLDLDGNFIDENDRDTLDNSDLLDFTPDF